LTGLRRRHSTGH